ncbi:DUF805 domain-containing protein [Amorphus orientalis]|uniref:Uncharacterized membrane protein YhaH (DUF805 family) n=1 Tax=Amorphus orientalis TaxID=649198 RepID=A0AAE3VNG7_9HYPH|nr:DUF805 domain-containing protein [Amorphus orientalis]MDQ0315834.1 uncharacterized membrane protein YhaH (DUF805 family) [Amorphus orientalis]
MRGDVLHYDSESGLGHISGDDGARYTFGRSDLGRSEPIAAGERVDFRVDGTVARDIFPAPAPHPSVSATPFAVSAPIDQPLSFWGYFWACLTSRYVQVSGRARRKEYWAFFVFSILAQFLILPVGLVIDGVIRNVVSGGIPVATIALFGLFYLCMLLPGIAVFVRRLHDIGLSGWFALLFYAMSFFYVGVIAMIVVALIPSQAHDNKWGPMPARRQT